MSTETPPTRTGRPRADQRPVERPPREEIVAVASRLFAERGVAGTTMSEIARRSGLRQSSVYYYFPDKEAILETILGTVNRAILDELARINLAGGSAALRLYRLIRHDAQQICAFSYDINELYRLSTLQEERFAPFWAERAELNQAVEDLLREGVATGEFVDLDPRLCALTLLSNDEGTQNWYRPIGAQGQLGDERFDPDEIAAFMANFALSSLLRDRRALTRIQRDPLTRLVTIP